LKRIDRDGRADLDWVVMKCLEKERDRRYETANGLAMDTCAYPRSPHIAGVGAIAVSGAAVYAVARSEAFHGPFIIAKWHRDSWSPLGSGLEGWVSSPISMDTTSNSHFDPTGG